MRAFPVQPTTPLGPDQVNVLLLLFSILSTLPDHSGFWRLSGHSVIDNPKG
jgi:hypothetical protein